MLGLLGKESTFQMDRVNDHNPTLGHIDNSLFMPRKPHTLAAGLISTAASARCSDARSLGQLFQQFVARGGKPLKRLLGVHALPDRAKAAVLMRRAGTSYGPFALAAPIAVLVLGLAGQLPAQALKTLCTFPNGYGGVSIVSGNTLYGSWTGNAGTGASPIANDAIFAVNTDGTGFRTVHSFEPVPYINGVVWSNSDGLFPTGLILSGNTLYGTCGGGGPWGKGTIFAVNTDGTGFTTLYIFSASDGGGPGSLTFSGSTLYGTMGGSISDYGTVFTVNTHGTGLTTLYSFTAGTDGSYPHGLILSGNTLYGTTAGGGSFGRGAVFAVNTDGTGFTTLYSFTVPQGPGYTNSDGSTPITSVILSGTTLYGTCNRGGPWGNGTIFAVNTDGTGFRTLYSFSATTSTNSLGVYTNSDGRAPYNNLVLSGNTLFGTTYDGGLGGDGTIFAVNTDGTGFTNLHNVDWGVGTLFASNNTLYGTLASHTNVTIFSVSLPIGQPQLTITPSATNFILTWPTSFTGFTLQSTTNLGSSAVWTTNSPAPVIVNGLNTVTNPLSGTQQFYRLAQ